MTKSLKADYKIDTFTFTFFFLQSIRDCIQYYYNSKKSKNYKQQVKRHAVKKRNFAKKKPEIPKEEKIDDQIHIVIQE